jgi:hypothetical protein
MMPCLLVVAAGCGSGVGVGVGVGSAIVLPFVKLWQTLPQWRMVSQ